MPSHLQIRTTHSLQGHGLIGGDKSITHRAIILASLANGVSYIHRPSLGRDCLATLDVMRALGVKINTLSTGFHVYANGMHSLMKPRQDLWCASSGTTMRLCAGLLIAQPFSSVLTASSQLQARPMERVVNPLCQMGGRIVSNAGKPPLLIEPTNHLQTIAYKMPIASAQVKSALLLANLYTHQEFILEEAGPSRDHTERLLLHMGVTLERQGTCLRMPAQQVALQPIDIAIPGDMSSAAFLIAAATLCKNSQVRFSNINTNTTRTGFWDALMVMGQSFDIQNIYLEAGEPVTDFTVSHCELQAANFGQSDVVRMIDELMLLAVIATQAHGITVIRDAQELKVKETNRLQTIAVGLQKMGARIEPTQDGWVIEGPTILSGANVDSEGDHRIAMALAVAGLIATGTTIVQGADAIADSFPDFVRALQQLGAQIEKVFT